MLFLSIGTVVDSPEKDIIFEESKIKLSAFLNTWSFGVALGTFQTLEIYSLLKSWYQNSAGGEIFIGFMAFETGLPIKEPDLSCTYWLQEIR